LLGAFVWYLHILELCVITCYSSVSVISDAVYLYVAASFFAHRRVFNA
jgi:hypothetical protein